MLNKAVHSPDSRDGKINSIFSWKKIIEFVAIFNNLWLSIIHVSPICKIYSSLPKICKSYIPLWHQTSGLRFRILSSKSGPYMNEAPKVQFPGCRQCAPSLPKDLWIRKISHLLPQTPYIQRWDKEKIIVMDTPIQKRRKEKYNP